MTVVEMKTCPKCGKTKKADIDFYKRKDGSRTDLCKSCLTMHIDNFDPDTFLWILEDMDIPYIPEEWNVLRDKAFELARQKGKVLDGMSVFGKYLSKMKLKQWMKYHWADSEMLQRENAERQRIAAEGRAEYEAGLKEQLDKGEINEAQYRTLVSTPTQNEELYYAEPALPPEAYNPYGDGSQFIDESILDEAAESLTDDDKIYLAMKWGRNYKPSEWLELEKLYNEMTESFDIQDADTIHTLILVCKTNLKMNQYLDTGDIEGFQKVSRVNESLRKSAKFTAAQNKEQKSEFVNSIGELVDYCEKTGGAIPRYEIEAKQDIIDKVIKDLKDYTKGLIYEDKSLAKQIEDFLKRNENLKQQKQDLKEAKERGEDIVTLDDDDLIAHEENLEQQRQHDDQIYNGDDE